MSRPVIFLDDGGVMNDNERRGHQWQRLIGEHFGPLLGGDLTAWARANVVWFEREMARYEQRRLSDPLFGLESDRVASNDRWLCEMAADVGVAVPSALADRLKMVDDANALITRNVHADYPGAVDAIRTLHRAGYVLYTASGEHSLELEGYLIGMEVLHCFQTLYGPDLVRTSKTSPRYYEQIFAQVGIAPAEALVVDDTESVLEWAAAVGARTVLCRPEPPRSSRHGHVTALAELPGVLGVPGHV